MSDKAQKEYADSLRKNRIMTSEERRRAFLNWLVSRYFRRKAKD